MALKIYEAEINGHRTTVQLSEEDAKARGLTDKDTIAARKRATAEKAEVAKTEEWLAAEEAWKEAEAAKVAADAKAAPAANKARTPANKAAEK